MTAVRQMGPSENPRNKIPESGFGSNFAEHVEGIRVDDQVLGGRANLDDLGHLLLVVGQRPDSQGTVQLEEKPERDG